MQMTVTERWALLDAVEEIVAKEKGVS